MARKSYLVTLSPEERQWLAAPVKAGQRSALTLTRARTPLKADQAPGGPAWPDADIASALDCGLRTAERVRALRLAGRLYEQGTAEEAGLEAHRAFLAAATVLHGWPRRPVFRDAADFKARLQAGDPVALAADRVLIEAGL